MNNRIRKDEAVVAGIPPTLYAPNLIARILAREEWRRIRALRMAGAAAADPAMGPPAEHSEAPWPRPPVEHGVVAGQPVVRDFAYDDLDLDDVPSRSAAGGRSSGRSWGHKPHSPRQIHQPATPGQQWPGMTILPSKFKCTECGCTIAEQKLGYVECAWCGGHGRRL